MRCRTARAHLPLLLDEALPLGKHHEVAEHIRTCRACASVMASLEEALPPLPKLPDRIMAQFGQELEASLDEEIALIELAARRERWRTREPLGSRAWSMLYGAFMGATVSLVLVAVMLPRTTGIDAGRNVSRFLPTAYADSRAPRYDESTSAGWWRTEAASRDGEPNCLSPLESTSEQFESSLMRTCASIETAASGPALIRTVSTAGR